MTGPRRQLKGPAPEPPVIALQTLTLQNYGITSLQGLGIQPDLECLELQNNYIKTLDGLEMQPNLKELHLQENSIKDFRFAQPQPQLQVLNLEGNPIARHPNYRIMAILAFGGQLVCIDGHEVTAHEQDVAHHLGPSASTAVKAGWLLDFGKERTEEDYQRITDRLAEKRRLGWSPRLSRNGVPLQDLDLEECSASPPLHQMPPHGQQQSRPSPGSKQNCRRGWSPTGLQDPSLPTRPQLQRSQQPSPVSERPFTPSEAASQVATCVSPPAPKYLTTRDGNLPYEQLNRPRQPSPTMIADPVPQVKPQHKRLGPPGPLVSRHVKGSPSRASIPTKQRMATCQPSNRRQAQSLGEQPHGDQRLHARAPLPVATYEPKFSQTPKMATASLLPQSPERCTSSPDTLDIDFEEELAWRRLSRGSHDGILSTMNCATPNGRLLDSSPAKSLETAAIISELRAKIQESEKRYEELQMMFAQERAKNLALLQERQSPSGQPMSHGLLPSEVESITGFCFGGGISVASNFPLCLPGGGASSPHTPQIRSAALGLGVIINSAYVMLEESRLTFCRYFDRSKVFDVSYYDVTECRLDDAHHCLLLRTRGGGIYELTTQNDNVRYVMYKCLCFQRGETPKGRSITASPVVRPGHSDASRGRRISTSSSVAMDQHSNRLPYHRGSKFDHDEVSSQEGATVACFQRQPPVENGSQPMTSDERYNSTSSPDPDPPAQPAVILRAPQSHQHAEQPPARGAQAEHSSSRRASEQLRRRSSAQSTLAQLSYNPAANNAPSHSPSDDLHASPHIGHTPQTQSRRESAAGSGHMVLIGHPEKRAGSFSGQAITNAEDSSSSAYQSEEEKWQAPPSAPVVIPPSQLQLAHAATTAGGAVQPDAEDNDSDTASLSGGSEAGAAHSTAPHHADKQATPSSGAVTDAKPLEVAETSRAANGLAEPDSKVSLLDQLKLSRRMQAIELAQKAMSNASGASDTDSPSTARSKRSSVHHGNSATPKSARSRISNKSTDDDGDDSPSDGEPKHHQGRGSTGRMSVPRALFGNALQMDETSSGQHRPFDEP